MKYLVLLAAVLSISGCGSYKPIDYLPCKPNGTWGYAFYNETAAPVYILSFGNSKSFLYAGPELNTPKKRLDLNDPDVWWMGGFNDKIKPFWYLYLRYSTSDGKIHEKEFYLPVPFWKWRYVNSSQSQILILFRDNNVVEVHTNPFAGKNK